ncbi:tetratricopeptide repeat protein [Oleiharenicola lentus]|uniref:tetratricopeptide repeat protein n=1 Tax=Oleiharenicola lentus TaxID=2508720 RepID=UPI003F67ACC4
MRSSLHFIFALIASNLLTPVFAQTPQQQVAALLEKKEYLAAERIVEPLANAKNADAVSLYQLSVIRSAQHRNPEALKLAERAIKLDSSKAEYFSHLSKTYGFVASESTGGFFTDKIRKSLEQSLKLDPNHVPGLVGMVRFYTNATVKEGGSFKKAREYADRLLKVDPAQGELEHGSLDLRLTHVESALVHFEKALHLKPNDALANYFTGVALQTLGRKVEARARFTNALKLDPSLNEVREALQALDNQS